MFEGEKERGIEGESQMAVFPIENRLSITGTHFPSRCTHNHTEPLTISFTLMACKLRDKAIELFKENFNERPSVYAYAPGRVNFIGEHTDYCEGFVCPLAIHYGTAVVGKLVPGNVSSPTRS